MGFKDIEFTEDEFAALQKAYSGILANQEKSPEYIFQKSLLSTLYDSPRNQAINSSIIEKASRNPILEVAHAMTANAADWTFILSAMSIRQHSVRWLKNISPRSPATKRQL